MSMSLFVVVEVVTCISDTTSTDHEQSSVDLLYSLSNNRNVQAETQKIGV